MQTKLSPEMDIVASKCPSSSDYIDAFIAWVTDRKPFLTLSCRPSDSVWCLDFRHTEQARAMEKLVSTTRIPTAFRAECHPRFVLRKLQELNPDDHIVLIERY